MDLRSRVDIYWTSDLFMLREPLHFSRRDNERQFRNSLNNKGNCTNKSFHSSPAANSDDLLLIYMKILIFSVVSQTIFPNSARTSLVSDLFKFCRFTQSLNGIREATFVDLQKHVEIMSFNARIAKGSIEPRIVW